MFLVVDVEGSGLIKRDLPLSNPSQPWCMSIAARLMDESFVPLDWMYTRIRSDGRRVEAGAERVHGVSARAAARMGISEIAALGCLIGLAAQSRYLIGHGVDYERQIIAGVLERQNKNTSIWMRPGLEVICTMKAAAPFCRLPSGRDDNDWKWPTLDQACETLLGEAPRSGTHNAWDDMERADRLFQHLHGKNAFDF